MSAVLPLPQLFADALTNLARRTLSSSPPRTLPFQAITALQELTDTEALEDSPQHARLLIDALVRPLDSPLDFDSGCR